ncbi:MAG: hypothetical protein KatS3mg009_2542 [Acidimicrobiia bacterium]|nr:MAG: hypothetical protein KatS3mg009_2542 [Acidimicrobiia bacterium]
MERAELLFACGEVVAGGGEVVFEGGDPGGELLGAGGEGLPLVAGGGEVALALRERVAGGGEVAFESGDPGLEPGGLVPRGVGVAGRGRQLVAGGRELRVEPGELALTFGQLALALGELAARRAVALGLQLELRDAGAQRVALGREVGERAGPRVERLLEPGDPRRLLGEVAAGVLELLVRGVEVAAHRVGARLGVRQPRVEQPGPGRLALGVGARLRERGRGAVGLLAGGRHRALELGDPPLELRRPVPPLVDRPLQLVDPALHLGDAALLSGGPGLQVVALPAQGLQAVLHVGGASPCGAQFLVELGDPPLERRALLVGPGARLVRLGARPLGLLPSGLGLLPPGLGLGALGLGLGARVGQDRFELGDPPPELVALAFARGELVPEGREPCLVVVQGATRVVALRVGVGEAVAQRRDLGAQRLGTGACLAQRGVGRVELAAQAGEPLVERRDEAPRDVVGRLAPRSEERDGRGTGVVAGFEAEGPYERGDRRVRGRRRRCRGPGRAGRGLAGGSLGSFVGPGELVEGGEAERAQGGGLGVERRGQRLARVPRQGRGLERAVRLDDRVVEREDLLRRRRLGRRVGGPGRPGVAARPPAAAVARRLHAHPTRGAFHHVLHIRPLGVGSKHDFRPLRRPAVPPAGPDGPDPAEHAPGQAPGRAPGGGCGVCHGPIFGDRPARVADGAGGVGWGGWGLTPWRLVGTLWVQREPSGGSGRETPDSRDGRRQGERGDVPGGAPALPGREGARDPAGPVPRAARGGCGDRQGARRLPRRVPDRRVRAPRPAACAKPASVGRGSVRPPGRSSPARARSPPTARGGSRSPSTCGSTRRSRAT